MKLIQINGAFISQKFKTTLLRFDYNIIDDMAADPFSVLVTMNNNELLEDLDEEKTFNLIKNFSEHMRVELARRFKEGIGLSENYYFEDEVDLIWLKKRYEGGHQAIMIIINE
jgi:hypothetical protein